MKLKVLKNALAAAAFAAALTGGVLCAENGVVAEEKVVTYGLYTTQGLATAKSGKLFTQVGVSDAVILTADGNGDGLNQANRKVASQNNDSAIYFNLGTDTAYTYNAGIIGTTPNGTSYYQNYGNSQMFYNAYPGPVQRGGEWLLTEAVDTQDYWAISYDIAYVAKTVTAGDLVGDSYIYVYGKDESGNAVVVNKKVEFGVNYWTTGVVAFSDEMVSVERIAVSILWGTVTQQSAERDNYVYLTDFTVHAKSDTTKDKRLTANEHGLDFYNGVQSCGLLDGKSMKVFHSNTGYAANFGVTGGNYAYGTQRMSRGSFVTVRFTEPVFVDDYKYFDLQLQALPQVAEGEKWLAETADKFYVSVLKGNAETTESESVYELSKKQWTTCRIELADFADANGYVNRLIVCYTGNNAGRTENEDKYSIMLGILDGTLTNYEQTETVAYYAEPPKVGAEEITVRFKTSATFRYNESVSSEFLDGVTFNGKTLSSLIVDEKASILLNGNYIQISVVKTEWKLDGADEISMAKGVAVRDGLTMKDKEVFRYDPSLNRMDLLPDENAEKKSQISLERVETGTIDEQNNMYGQTVVENSIFVTFKYPVCFNANSGHMQAEMSEMGVWSGATDSYVYELAKMGVIQSCMDLLYVNGKSIREWMALDHADGLDGLIRVSFMGTWNWGKVLRVMAAEDSHLQLGAGKDMSVEFKAGFITPMGEYVEKDMLCKISAANATGPNCTFDIVDETDYEIVNQDGTFENSDGGCGATVAFAPLTATLLGACVAVFVQKRKGGKEE